MAVKDNKNAEGAPKCALKKTMKRKQQLNKNPK